MWINSVVVVGGGGGGSDCGGVVLWVHFVDVIVSVSIQSEKREGEERRSGAESEGRPGGVHRQIQFICKTNM